MKTIICDKCHRPLQGVERNIQVDIVMDENSQEWQLDLCTECAEIFDLFFLDTFKDYKIPIYEQPSLSGEDYSDDEVVNQAVDVWGGAGPDCSSIRVAPVDVEIDI